MAVILDFWYLTIQAITLTLNQLSLNSVRTLGVWPVFYGKLSTLQEKNRGEIGKYLNDSVPISTSSLEREIPEAAWSVSFRVTAKYAREIHSVRESCKAFFNQQRSKYCKEAHTKQLLKMSWFLGNLQDIISLPSPRAMVVSASTTA